MSFLAGLREHQSDITPPSVTLRYILTIDASTQNLELCLRLHNAASHGQDTLKEYHIQREHLMRPPAFISPQDKEILEKICHADSEWFGRECGLLPSAQPSETIRGILELILTTDRCDYITHNGRRLSLHKASTTTVTPHWTILANGEQQLNWQLPNGVKGIVVFVGSEIAYLHQEGSHYLLGFADYSHAETGFSPQLQLAAGPTNTNQRAWIKRWRLPEPKALSPVDVPAKLIPLLCCSMATDSAGQHQEHIRLRFSVSDDNYCSLPSESAEEGMLEASYWDGECLHQLSGNERQRKEWLIKAADKLTVIPADPCGSLWVPQSDDAWRTFFTQCSPALETWGIHTVVMTGFGRHYVKAGHWRVNIGKAQDQHLHLNFSLQTSQGSVDLADLLDQLQQFNREKSVPELSLRLADGRLLLVPAQQLFSLMDELKDLELESEGYRVNRAERHRLAAIDEYLPDEVRWLGDTDQLEHAIALQQSPVVLDRHLDCVDATLRPYQWLGVSWIRHLKLHGYNGLLADDMGLGKTLQTLTHLAFEKQVGELNKPALIVVPLSLIHNWVKEIQRFAKQLKVKVVHGPKRHDDWRHLCENDVLITTYHLVASDLAFWQEQPLSWLILDEAQHIKNPNTRYSQAVRDVVSGHRLCLSGTPVENHLGELWSILSFLNPGCLGSLADFKTHFQKPIEQDADHKRLAKLLDRIAPFMLRRTKDQIAQDLPAKTEIYQHIPLNEKQRDFYEQLKLQTWQELQSKIESGENNGQHHIAALTALLQLRQACCDPALLDDLSDIPSAKREHCMDMVSELVEEGRAVLIFSQFTQMLDLLDEALSEKNISSLKLTGKTKNRQVLVDAFQRGDAPVFLISLKAGGTGLNLTRADTVIHYDPWWNSAAEKQASDRAHRIGQDKPVFVYKLIAEDTIEEKIAQLQTQKAAISDHVDQRAQISAESFAFKFEEILSLWQEEQTP